MATFDFQAYRADVERKAAQARQATAGFFEGGKPIYNPEIHQQRLSQALAPLRQAVSEAQEYAQRAQALTWACL